MRIKAAISFTISSDRCNSGRGGAGLFEREQSMMELQFYNKFDKGKTNSYVYSGGSDSYACILQIRV